MSWVSSLKQQKQREDLKAIISSVHKIAHEDVICARHLSPRLEQLHEIMELAVYVTAYLHQGAAPSLIPYTSRSLQPTDQLPPFWGEDFSALTYVYNDCVLELRLSYYHACAVQQTKHRIQWMHHTPLGMHHILTTGVGVQAPVRNPDADDLLGSVEGNARSIPPLPRPTS